MTMAVDRVLLDTSVLVAASVEEHPSHVPAAEYVDQLRKSGAIACVNPQVCREFLVVLTRASIGPRAFSLDEALNALEVWRTSCVFLEESESAFHLWLDLVKEYRVRGKQIHDTNIVAVMLAHGVRRIGTRNADDFDRYGNLIQVDSVGS